MDVVTSVVNIVTSVVNVVGLVCWSFNVSL